MRDLLNSAGLLGATLGVTFGVLGCGRIDADRRGLPGRSLQTFAGLRPEHLDHGGPPAALWLAGALTSSPNVSARRLPGIGADLRRAAARDGDVTLTALPHRLDADVSIRPRLTWGCGGESEWRESETAHPRLVADVIEVCGYHGINDSEVRFEIRARHLILRNAHLGTESEGYFDVRATKLSLEGTSRITSRAPDAAEPPFSSSAGIFASAGEVDGAGKLSIEAFGADYRSTGRR